MTGAPAPDRELAQPRRTPPRVRPRPEPAHQDAGPAPTSAAPAAGAMLQLQATAGNAAITALLEGGPTSRTVQRLAGGAIPPPPAPPKPPVPGQHPGFKASQSRIGAARRAIAKHPSAKSRAAEAAKAAKPPADDKEAQGKAAKAGEMGAAPTGTFDKAAFIAAVTAAIAKQTPKTLDEADKFATSGKSDAIAAEVKGKVSQGKESSAKPMADASAKAPDTSQAVEKPVSPLAGPPAAAPPPKVDAAAAMPTKAPANQTELGNGPAATDAKMAEAGVTEDQLAKSNEPEFTGALAAKKEGEQHSATAPAAFRDAEAQQIAAAQQGAQGAGAQATAGMVAAKGTSQQQVAGAQQRTQSADEQKRAEVTAKVKSIFDATKTDVDKILTDLDGLVDKQFTDGEAKAKAAFTADHEAKMEKYKDERYSGPAGWARWTADLITSVPEEVNRFYEQAKRVYESQMTTVISQIADTVGKELTRARERVAKGRADIKTYVDGLDPALRSVGGQAAKDIGSQFDALEESINEKSQSLVEDLAEKYVAARNEVDNQIKAMQEENKGLWDKAKDAVGGAIETILKLKSMLTGVLARAAGAIEQIIKDPIRFLGNLVNAVKTGVMNFGSNILTHLKKGLQSWLFGALAEAGVAIPDKFDLKGIVTLVLSLLGLTWASIRARLAKVLPEWVLKALETAVEVVKILTTEGVGGLWTWIVQKLSDLKEQVFSQIKDFVITKIITAGITWLISLLNPAAAFIKACKMIYDAVMWFVENAQRMKEFVDSVLDSVESVASGGVGKVAALIEATLGRAVPMVISGLASLLGLGGIADKIKKILETVQKPVGKVVDGIISGVIKYGKKLLKKLKRKKKDEDPAAQEKRYDKGLKMAKGVVDRIPGKTLKETVAKPLLMGIKLAHRMPKLELVAGETHYEVQRATTLKTSKKVSKIDPAKVKAAVATAKAEYGTAMAEYNKVKGSAPDTTVASGGGVIKTQGGGSLSDAERDPEAAQRWLEADAAKWGGLGEVNAAHMKEMLTLTPAAEKKLKRLRKKESIDELLSKMSSYQYPGRTKEQREAYQKETGQYLPRRSFKDRGVPGATSLVHAEKLVRGQTGSNAIGVSRAQCGDCQAWFQAQAKGDEFAVVYDGVEVRVYAEGAIRKPSDFK